MTETVQEPARRTPVAGDVDVVVAGTLAVVPADYRAIRQSYTVAQGKAQP